MPHRQRLAARLLCLGILGLLGSAIGCGRAEDGASMLTATLLLTGETVQVPANKICWHTATPIPAGYVATPDPVNKQVLFVPEKRAGIALSEEKDPGSDIGGVKCLCNRESGGCSPAAIDGVFYCFMSTCTDCSKYTIPPVSDPPQ